MTRWQLCPPRQLQIFPVELSRVHPARPPLSSPKRERNSLRTCLGLLQRYMSMEIYRVALEVCCVPWAGILLVSAGMPWLRPSCADNRTTTGEFIVDPPTPINLGFEWFIQGDDNRNASVALAYRKQGPPNGAPAFRCCACRVSESQGTIGWTSSRRTCSQAALSISSRTPRMRFDRHLAIRMASPANRRKT